MNGLRIYLCLPSGCNITVLVEGKDSSENSYAKLAVGIE